MKALLKIFKYVNSHRWEAFVVGASFIFVLVKIFFYVEKWWIVLLAVALFCVLLFIFTKIFLAIFIPDKNSIVNIYYWQLLVVLMFFVVGLLFQEIFSKRDWELVGYILPFLKDFSLLLIGGVLIFLTFYGMGKKAMLFIDKNSSSFGEDFLYSIGIGAGIIGYLVYFFSALKLAYPIMAFALIILSITISWKEIVILIKKAFEKKVAIRREKDLLTNMLLFALVAFFLFGFIQSLGNIANGQWDTFHQYLTFPKEYAENHGLVEFKYHPHWGFPQLGEMLFLFGILVFGIKMPFLMNAVFFILFAYVLKVLFSKMGIKEYLLGISWIVTIPFFALFYGGYLKIEIVFAFFIILIFIQAYEIIVKNKSSIVLLVILSGLLLAIKYTALIFLVAIFVTFISYERRIINWKNMLIVLGIAGAIFLPWAVKNVLYYNNPVYPLIGGSDFLQENLGLDCHSNFIKNCKVDAFIAPGESVVKFNNDILSNLAVFLKISFWGNKYSINQIGPFFALSLIIIGLFSRKDKTKIKFLYYFSGVYFVFWTVFLAGQMWYLLPVAISILIYAVYLAEMHNFFGQYVYLKFLTIVWIIFSCCLFISTLYLNEFTIGKIDHEKYLEKKSAAKDDSLNFLDWYRMWNYINKESLDGNKKIYGLLDTQGYFIKNSHENFIPDFFGYAFSCMSNSNIALLESFKKIGVGYILFNKDANGLCEIKNRDMFGMCKVMDKFKKFVEENDIREVHREGNIVLYGL